MNTEEIRKHVIAALKSVAPEIDAEALAGDRPLRRQADLDSMDWLNFLLGLNKKFGIAIPEADYRRLATLDDLVRYLAGRTREN